MTPITCDFPIFVNSVYSRLILIDINLQILKDTVKNPFCSLCPILNEHITYILKYDLNYVALYFSIQEFCGGLFLQFLIQKYKSQHCI